MILFIYFVIVPIPEECDRSLTFITLKIYSRTDSSDWLRSQSDLPTWAIFVSAIWNLWNLWRSRNAVIFRDEVLPIWSMASSTRPSSWLQWSTNCILLPRGVLDQWLGSLRIWAPLKLMLKGALEGIQEIQDLEDCSEIIWVNSLLVSRVSAVSLQTLLLSYKLFIKACS